MDGDLMTLTRREFLTGVAGGAGAVLLPPIVGRVGPAFGAAPVDPATATRNRVVIVFLAGGNDGLNYVVPRGDVPGQPRLSVYKKVRPTLAYDPGETLALNRPGDADQLLGFNHQLPTLHRFYRDGRVAIVQGVDYPKHNYSHFASTDIWHSGEPERSPSSGWLGRHFDRIATGEGELRAAAIGTSLPLILQGKRPSAASIASIAATRFADGTVPIAEARHASLAGFAGGRNGDPLRDFAARIGKQTVGVVDELKKAVQPPATGTMIGDSLLTARVLLEQNLGVECVYLEHGGFDTHAGQRKQQETLLAQLDTALETFWLGTAKGAAVGDIGPLAPAVAERTLVFIVSEFGRRIGEAGGAAVAGTDHGAAAPVVLVGPPPGSGKGGPELVPGLHGDHPSLGTVTAPADNLVMTTDLREVYEAILRSWLADSDPLYDRRPALKGLFTAGSALGAGGAGSATTGRPARVRAGAAAAAAAAGGAPPSGDAALAPQQRGRDGVLRINERSGSHKLHPVTAAAAVAFDAVIALLLIRSGKLRELGGKWRAWRAS
jgi:uncharacterized protein (DUF1501 family)